MPAPISRSEFEERQARVAEAARERGYSGILAWSTGGNSPMMGDVMYLANHNAHVGPLPATKFMHSWTYSAVIIAADGATALLTSALNDPDGVTAIDDARQVRDLPQAVADKLIEMGLDKGKIGLAAHDTLLASSYDKLVAALGGKADFEACDDILERMRMVKSEGEIALMREAARIGVGWFDTAMNAIQEGATEGVVVGEGFRYLAAAGGTMIDSAISSGPNSEFIWGSSMVPHWNATRKFVPGDMVHVDLWGPVCQGYYTDFARSTVVGRKPSDAQRDELEGAIDLIESIVAEMRPGVTCSELNSLGVRWMIDHGLLPEGADEEESVGHSDQYPSFGHGLGLELENPQLSADDHTVLEPGMIFAIETLIGSAMFEHNVLITKDGHDILTAASTAKWWD